MDPTKLVAIPNVDEVATTPPERAPVPKHRRERSSSTTDSTVVDNLVTLRLSATTCAELSAALAGAGSAPRDWHDC